MSIDSIREKYSSYWGDVDLFYQHNFNMKMNLSLMYIEEGSSFSNATVDTDLLDDFRGAIVGGGFPGIPTGACAYHLMTGRYVPGIGGLSWVGTACDSNNYNAGFSVDVFSQDDTVTVLRRLIHELGHSFGGQHWYVYSDNALYDCNAGLSESEERILRSVPTEQYEFIDDSLFITECSTITMVNSLPGFSCLWTAPAVASAPTVTLYTNEYFGGDSFTISARNGYSSSTCYNIVYPWGDLTAAFQLSGPVTGIQFYANEDCNGQQWQFANTTFSTYVGDDAYEQFNSFQFL